MTPAEELTAEELTAEAERLQADRFDPRQLDELWDLDDPAVSERRIESLLGTGDLPPIARAELQTQLARALGLQGRYDDALKILDAVLESIGNAEPAADVEGTQPAGASASRPSATPRAPVVVIRVALERGRVLNSSGRPADSVELFTRALQAARAAGEDFLAIDAAHMLAIADRTRAEHWTNEALRMVTTSTDPRTRRWAGSLHNNAGWARHDAGDDAAALAEFEAAQSAYEVNGTAEQVRVARWAVARALRSLARFDEALAIQQQLAEQGPSDGYVQEELAELCLATGRPDEAREHAAAAVELLGSDSWFTEYESGRWERLRRIARLD
jgi:tetratricopeptide (TPR) repeat protein